MFVSDNDNYLIGMTLTEMLPNGDILGQKQEVKMVFNQVLSGWEILRSPLKK